MIYTLEKANNYIQLNQHKVNPTYRLKYHAMPPIGWMNDPNGVNFFHNQYHIFYQYHPYASSNGAMHWGHFVSKDLIRFQDQSVVLAPDCYDESGCFSGGSIVDQTNGDLVLFYTKHFENNGFKSETQNIARSKDGVHFYKNETPVITTRMIPEQADQIEFRDPNPYFHDGYYYIFIGSRDLQQKGQILVYRSPNLKDYKYHFTIGPSWYFGDMGECPDFFHLDGYDILLFSATNLKAEANRFKNANSSLYIIGKMDFEGKKFDIVKVEEIDGGHDFYAPQTLQDPKNRRIMIGWMNMWSKEYFTHKIGHNWSGALTIPRELHIKDGTLYQSPIEEINKYHQNQQSFENGMLIQKEADLNLTISGLNWNLCFSNENDPEDFFMVGKEEEKFFIDLTHSKQWPQERRYSFYSYQQDLTLRILLDTCSCEIFIDQGIDTLTSLTYFDSTKYQLMLHGDGIITDSTIYEIVIKEENEHET